MKHYIYTDWDASGALSIAETDRLFDCSVPTHGVDGLDYLGDYCDPDDNTGTVFDWIRFFWDLTVQVDVLPRDIAGVIADADTEHWVKTGSG